MQFLTQVYRILLFIASGIKCIPTLILINEENVRTKRGKVVPLLKELSTTP
jgi:hypothetical protein